MKTKLATFIALLTAAAVTALSLHRIKGPGPTDDPLTFSAVRAQRIVAELVREREPHPVSTPANARVRDRIVAHLRTLGYTPQIQRQMACSSGGECSRVENIIAAAPGERRESILVACHYDSVPAGAGAADDISGVALTLEIARLVRAIERRNSVIFLIDDGEESGLLGAEAFVRHHPAARDVGAVINVEARGTSGLSHMFETSDDHGWLIDIMQKQLRRPSSTSIFYSIYQRLPNDTDLTVFKRAKLEGVNFAFIGDPLRYHTPQDAPEHLSVRTLQHQGQNAWEMLQGLVRHDLSRRGGGERTYFDVLGFFLVVWPKSWNFILAILAAIALAVAAAVRLRGGTRAHLLHALLAGIATQILAAAAGYAVATLIRAPTSFIAAPLLPAFAVCTLALTIALTLRAVTRTTPAASLTLFGAVGVIAAITASALLPGGAYIGVVVAVAATIALLLHHDEKPLRSSLAAMIAVAPTAVVLLPLVLLLPDGMGTPTLAGLGAAAALIALPIAAWAAPRRFAAALAACFALAAVALTIASYMAEPYAPSERRPVNITRFVDADAQTTAWLTTAKPLPAALAAAGSWSPSAPPLRGLQGPAYMRAPSAHLALPPPELQVLQNERTGSGRTLELRISSPRAAYKIALVLDNVEARLITAELNGQPLELSARYWKRMPPGVLRVGYRGMPLAPGGVTITLRLRGNQPVTGYLYDTSFGVSDDVYTRLRSSRETTIQDGDTTIVKREIKL